MYAIISMNYNRSIYSIQVMPNSFTYLTESSRAMKELLKAFGITEVRIDPDLSDSYRALIKSFLV